MKYLLLKANSAWEPRRDWWEKVEEGETTNEDFLINTTSMKPRSEGSYLLYEIVGEPIKFEVQTVTSRRVIRT